MVGRATRLTLYVGICAYIFDLVTDFIFSVKEFQQGNIGLGVVMGIFIVIPNAWGNYMAMDIHQINTAPNPKTDEGGMDVEEGAPNEIEGRCYRLKRTVNGVWTEIKKWMFPYPFISARNVVYNLLCVIQLRPLIMAMDLLNHDKKSVKQITRQSCDFADIRYFENVVENIPQFAIQLLLLLQIVVIDKEILTGDQIFRVVALGSKLLSISLALTNLQFKSRLANKNSYDHMIIIRPLKNLAHKNWLFEKLEKYIQFNVQSLSQCGIYLLMISSRSIFVGMVYFLLSEIKIPYVPKYQSAYILPLVLLELHHILTFLYGWWIARARLWKWPIPTRAIVYCYIWSFRNIFFNQLPRKVKDIGNLLKLYTFNLLQIILVGALLHNKQTSFPFQPVGNDTALVDLEDLPNPYTVIFTSVSVTLYCLAGVCVAFYFNMLDPEEAKGKHEWKILDDKLGDCDLFCDYEDQLVGTAVVTNTHYLTALGRAELGEGIGTAKV